MLFDLYDGDAAQIAQLMADFSEGEISLTDSALARAQSLFTSAKVSDEETCEEIRLAWQKTGQLLDPHTAIGTRAARLRARDGEGPMVTLSTAHPAKFPAAVARAETGQTPVLPDHLADLFDREEQFDTLDNDIAAVHAFHGVAVSTLSPPTIRRRQADISSALQNAALPETEAGVCEPRITDPGQLALGLDQLLPPAVSRV